MCRREGRGWVCRREGSGWVCRREGRKSVSTFEKRTFILLLLFISAAQVTQRLACGD